MDAIAGRIPLEPDVRRTLKGTKFYLLYSKLFGQSVVKSYDISCGAVVHLMKSSSCSIVGEKSD